MREKCSLCSGHIRSAEKAKKRKRGWYLGGYATYRPFVGLDPPLRSLFFKSPEVPLKISSTCTGFYGRKNTSLFYQKIGVCVAAIVDNLSQSSSLCNPHRLILNIPFFKKVPIMSFYALQLQRSWRRATVPPRRFGHKFANSKFNQTPRQRKRRKAPWSKPPWTK